MTAFSQWRTVLGSLRRGERPREYKD